MFKKRGRRRKRKKTKETDMHAKLQKIFPKILYIASFSKQCTIIIGLFPAVKIQCNEIHKRRTLIRRLLINMNKRFNKSFQKSNFYGSNKCR